MSRRAVPFLILFVMCALCADAQMIYPVPPQAAPEPAAANRDVTLLGAEPLKRPTDGNVEFLSGVGESGGAAFRVMGQQARIRIDEPAFVTPATTFAWSWKKEAGKVCILQLGVRNPQTGQQRYLGYGAGAWTEPPSGDPTIEISVNPEAPRQWTRVERNLHDDIHAILGWNDAQITELYLSPWDGEPGLFADAGFRGVSPKDFESARKEAELRTLSQSGSGHYMPSRLKNRDEKRVDKFETSFEECAPGRNSAANEWSIFGTDSGEKDFNAIGRELTVRYPVFDLVFRLYDGDKEIKPGELESFRLGLVDDRLPAIWAGWESGGLLYKVAAMTIPDPERGNFDLFKLQVQNPTNAAIAGKLVAALDGPPDMRVDGGVVRGLGDAPFLIADAHCDAQLTLRDWGLCDKRAKAYSAGTQPDNAERSLEHFRVGVDGVPVVYRVKAESDKKYAVYLAAARAISGYLLEAPKKAGDLVLEYRVEGCAPQTLDWYEYVQAKRGPICVGFENAHDTDGDGFIQVEAGAASNSPIRYAWLSAIYVFPEGAQPESVEAVYRGTMNDRCLHHIEVGSTPEQAANNQDYDKSDVGLARLRLNFTETLAAGEVKTYWLKVPPIHRREPVSMGYIAHAFREVLPGEAVPPFSDAQVEALRALDPASAERTLREHWDAFFAKAARFDLPDPVLNGVYLSRIATRAVFDTKIADDVFYNPCSAFFYFDHAYRDQAYVIYAYDLAGLHDRAARLLDVYCMDVKDVPTGPIAFDGRPLQLGMLEDGLWKTRPGQFDTQGQNIWALVQHYKLSGDREWLDETAYPYVRRGAMWIVRSRHAHMGEVGDPDDPRYGLIEPGAMEVMQVGKGMHMYYMNAFGILGLNEAADAAAALGKLEDAKLFMREARDLKEALHKSFVKTFKRQDLYEGNLWFGVEPEGVGMYGFWAHNCLLWPCRALDPQDPMLSATWRRMEWMAETWGGGMHSEGQGGFWPYIGVDRAVSYILRNEPDRALDYFCAFTDTAGGTFSWGEGYGNLIAGGDQPHMWADAQWVNLFRHLFVMEEGATLLITPATFRRWTAGATPISVKGLPTHFGDLDLTITPEPGEDALIYILRITPKGDQERRPLTKLLLYPRIAGGRDVREVKLNREALESFTNEVVIIPNPKRNAETRIEIGEAWSSAQLHRSGDVSE